MAIATQHLQCRSAQREEGSSAAVAWTCTGARPEPTARVLQVDNQQRMRQCKAPCRPQLLSLGGRQRLVNTGELGGGGG
jgi:hypothetical protein